MWLRLISVSMAAWILMPAISAPVNRRRTWMSWMSLPVIVLKHRPQAADDARLLAVRDGVVAHDVVADVLPGPAVCQRALDRLDVALGGVRRGVVPLVAVLAERDAGADRVADRVVLDDPALAPVRADQADLLGGGRGPGGGRVPHGEAAHGDVVRRRAFPGRRPPGAR